MPRAGQDLGQRLADLRFVVDDEYRALGARSRFAAGSAIGAARADGADRQRDGEHGAALGRAVDRQRAAVGFDDAEAHRQSDARADARGLGGEVGLEYPRAKMRRNAGPVVGDRDADHVGDRSRNGSSRASGAARAGPAAIAAR